MSAENPWSSSVSVGQRRSVSGQFLVQFGVADRGSPLHLVRVTAVDPITRPNASLEGRYHIERQLGEGGVATVYLADDVRHERKVALRLLPSRSRVAHPPIE